MKFSERMGFVKVSDVFQVNSMSQELRNRIYNFIDNSFFESKREIIYRELHCEFFKLKQGKFTYYSNISTRGSFEDCFDKSNWYTIYDLLEFIIQMYSKYNDFTQYVSYTKDQFVISINKTLEEERSGYRVIDDLVTPIIDNNEIESIEEAINQQDNTSIHLRTALQHLSNKHKPDYRNSIKESISAVEAMLRNITGDSNFGNAIKNIKTKIELPNSLKDGFEKLYGYTNGKQGIRHALMDETELKLEDAKFMLVSCSAFINYLKAKHLAT
ncbi:MAG: hypothetical protein E6Q32_11315 [Neisseriales bacterium]|nr:MAG: hypothetical protein E6Q32_11315 [Neisseriales bacterium]